MVIYPERGNFPPPMGTGGSVAVGTGSILLVGRNDPDIAELDGIAVILEPDGSRALRFIEPLVEGVGGDVTHFLVVVDKDAVVPNGDTRGGNLLAIFPHRGGVFDIIGLPLHGRAGGVYFRRGKFVEGTAFVPVAMEAVGVEDLNFVSPLEEEPAIAATLTGFSGFDGVAEFKVDAAVAKIFFRLDISADAVLAVLIGAGAAHFHSSVVEKMPGHGPTVAVLPLVEIFPVEKHDGSLWGNGPEGWGCAVDAFEVELHLFAAMVGRASQSLAGDLAAPSVRVENEGFTFEFRGPLEVGIGAGVELLGEADTVFALAHVHDLSRDRLVDIEVVAAGRIEVSAFVIPHEIEIGAGDIGPVRGEPLGGGQGGHGADEGCDEEKARIHGGSGSENTSLGTVVYHQFV